MDAVLSMDTNFIDKAIARLKSRRVSKAIYCASVIGYDGRIIECSNFPCAIGSICEIVGKSGSSSTGEVIRIKEQSVEIVPHEINFRVQISDQVYLIDDAQNVEVGPELLGRVIDGLGNPLDNRPKPNFSDLVSLNGTTQNPFERKPIKDILDVGIRSINALLTIGCGQRIGIIAGSGVGKSVLLSMITKSSNADVIVIALIGERGREVASFSSEILSSHSQEKVVIVAVPADRSPLLRIQGAKRATSIAEYFRSKGKRVLLIMDSLTRVAHAQREIGLALGEQPTSRGYPPSVISLLPNLIERTGNSSNETGSITSIYTVLADGDEINNDPVVDTARAILDGHIILSRDLAQQGIYPAIDVTQSISRIMGKLVDETTIINSMKLRKYISKYIENRDLFLMGGYVKGQDPDLDYALQYWPQILSFLNQSENEKSEVTNSIKSLKELVG